MKEEDISSLKEVLIEQMNSFTTHSQQKRTSREVQPAATMMKTALDILLGEEDNITTSSCSAKDEVAKIFSEPPVAQEGSPLAWWKSNKHRFPQLPTLAWAVVCIPATSTLSERVFSTAGITLNKLRSCLKPKNVDAILFLNKNLKAL